MCNSCDKMLLCILLPDFRHFFSPFTPPPASSPLSFGFSRRLSSSLHFTALSSYFLVLSLLCVLAPSQALLFFCSIWLFSGKSFASSSSYHCAFQPSLPAGLGRGSGSNTRWKTGIRHSYPYMASLV